MEKLNSEINVYFILFRSQFIKRLHIIRKEITKNINIVFSQNHSSHTFIIFAKCKLMHTLIYQIVHKLTSMSLNKFKYSHLLIFFLFLSCLQPIYIFIIIIHDDPFKSLFIHYNLK